MGACCTKGNTAAIISELAPAYAALHKATLPGANIAALQKEAVGVLMAAIRKRVKPNQMKPAAKALMNSGEEDSLGDATPWNEEP